MKIKILLFSVFLFIGCDNNKKLNSEIISPENTDRPSKEEPDRNNVNKTALCLDIVKFMKIPADDEKTFDSAFARISEEYGEDLVKKTFRTMLEDRRMYFSRCLREFGYLISDDSVRSCALKKLRDNC